jgi:predicted HAD superfamily hydrolase
MLFKIVFHTESQTQSIEMHFGDNSCKQTGDLRMPTQLHRSKWYISQSLSYKKQIIHLAHYIRSFS